MSGEDEVQRLLDIEAIKKLRGQYTRAIDTKDWDLYAASLAEDARLATDGGVNEGRDTIVANISKALTTAKTVHHLHTPEIELTGPDSATATWAMNDYVDFGAFLLRGYGHYHEEYVRTADGWKIKSSTLTRLRVDTEGEIPGR
jgi:uncharacterized protein (TIGR02246 family)